jgi:hypothetical protein
MTASWALHTIRVGCGAYLGQRPPRGESRCTITRSGCRRSAIGSRHGATRQFGMPCCLLVLRKREVRWMARVRQIAALCPRERPLSTDKMPMHRRSLALVDRRTAPVHFVCVRGDHLKAGEAVPDGNGHYSLKESLWAYCSAARAHEEHHWATTGGVPVAKLNHGTIAALVRHAP